MYVFLDTEFTNFQTPELISLALVAEGGQELYAERTDYSAENCSDFVRENVLPLLGRVPGAACTAPQLTERVRAWFQQLPEAANIVYGYCADRDLLTAITAGDPTNDREQPKNIALKIQLSEDTVADPNFERAAARAYTEAWPPHHALADARALLAGYRAWRAVIDGVS